MPSSICSELFAANNIFADKGLQHDIFQANNVFYKKRRNGAELTILR